MQIGYILTTFPALSETFVLNEILELERQGVTITVFSLRTPRTEPRHAGLSRLKARIVYLTEESFARPSFGDLVKAIPISLRAMIRGQFSEVRNIIRAVRIAAGGRRAGVKRWHAHFADRPASLAYWAHRMTKLPFSFTAHAIDIYEHGLRDALMVTKLRKTQFVITVCDFNKRFILEHYPGAEADRIRVINNCVDHDYFSFRDSQPSGPAQVLSVGRLVPKKGFDLLIRSCGLLRDRGLDVRFTVVGQGPEEARLRDLAESLGVADRIEFAGAAPQDRVRELLREATVFCMPFRRTASGDQDSLSLVLMEAMASGVPVISTRLAAIPEIVDDGENGILVEPEDANGLSNAIERLNADRALQDKLRKAARVKVERQFSLPVNVAKVRELMTAA